MKKIPFILSILALAGVLVLFLMEFTTLSENVERKELDHKTNDTGQSLKIAYVNTDSVLVNYKLALDLNAEFVEKQKQFNEEFTRKQSELERQAVAFQEKLQRGGFLTEERAISERDRILNEEQEIKQLDYELSNKLAEMEQNINMQVIDSIASYVKEYNKKHNYTYILSNNGNIIVGQQQYNISKDIVNGLNKRYAQSTK